MAYPINAGELGPIYGNLSESFLIANFMYLSESLRGWLVDKFYKNRFIKN